jgi:predicted permease
VTVLLPLLVFGLSYLFFRLLSKFTNFSRRTVLTLTIISGLNNTSFVGFPLIISFFGDQYLSIGVVSDQVTFFILSTFGVMLATSYSSHFKSGWQKTNYIIKRIVFFPPFIGCVMALVFADFLRHAEFVSFFSALAGTVSPLALFSIGIQLRFHNLSRELSAISYSLLFKLLLSPIVVLLVCYLLELKGVFYQVSAFEMMMPSLVSASMVIQQFGLNVKLTNTIIGVSILLGLLMSYGWFSALVNLL